MTDETPNPASLETSPPAPAERYGARCTEIELEYTEAVAQADADYSRVQHYIGQVRSQLVNLAISRRERRLVEAMHEYETALATEPLPTEKGN